MNRDRRIQTQQKRSLGQLPPAVNLKAASVTARSSLFEANSGTSTAAPGVRDIPGRVSHVM